MKIKTVDGLELYAHREGVGERTIMLLNGVGVSTFFWKYLRTYFNHRYQMIIWDYRGHGRSDQPKEIASFRFHHLLEDLSTIFQFFKLEQAILIGHSMGAALALDYASKFPRRVSAIVSVLGSYEHMLSELFHFRHSGTVFQILNAVNRQFPGKFNSIWRHLGKLPINYAMAKLTVVNGDFCKKEDMDSYFKHLSSMNFDFFMKALSECQKHSSRKKLSRIKCPTLIIGGDKDNFTPIRKSFEMYELIRGAELMVIPNGSHAAVVEQPEIICLRIEKFLRENEERRLKERR